MFLIYKAAFWRRAGRGRSGSAVSARARWCRYLTNHNWWSLLSPPDSDERLMWLNDMAGRVLN